MKVEIAALEPMLWKEEGHTVCNVVEKLKNMGFFVSMTTNGSLLSRYSTDLQSAGLDLLRVSWHSLDEDVFRRITGGGKLDVVRQGILDAIESGINVKINRVLLRGFTDDLGKQVEFVDRHRMTLKVLDLYWTPSSAKQYDQYYVSPQEVLAPFLQDSTLKAVEDQNGFGRQRKKYATANGGMIEYKIKETAEKSAELCCKCSFKDECIEGYGDYFRVFPGSTASLCYLRQDLATKDYDSIFGEGKMPLRFVLEGRCNFNCGFPNEEVSWCLKQGRGFKFPDRSGVIKIEHQRRKD